MELPKLPVPLTDFIPYLKKRSDDPVTDTVEPFKAYENKLREVFAQEPNHPAISDQKVNLVPVFAGHEEDFQIRARDVGNMDKDKIEKYVFPLVKEVRKPTGAPAVVSSLKDFKSNFNLFSESSLTDLKWDNVVAAGSSVVTALLPVPEKWGDSRRTQRDYYHDILAPASDVDLFLYGLNEEQAIGKIKQIETCVRDSILAETTTIRTKNAITICSQYPTRHVQIVLRLYKSISEIVTGFDVDCSCVAYDGSQVYASPRAIAAFATQINTIDLTRRSPSYENRLSKYSHRGFEVYWPELERSRVDPTVFERSFARIVGLARLLVLEKLPTPNEREDYLATRRSERARPPIYNPYKYRRHLPGNKKDQQPDDIAEWVEEDEVSNYHTFTVPYGPKYHAKKIEKLLYTKDLLLNSEWNRSKDRETELHRHPCFFGRVEDVIHDCCGYCPGPADDKDEELAEEERKIYVSGEIQFIKDDPGRQAIGSFHPLTDDDWTEMAYIGNTTLLCQAIVDGDVEHVQAWCEQEGNDVNRRDYTGRTPLHLATLCSTPKVAQCLIEHGARMISRLVDGFTALHIAAWRGNAAMVKTLLEKSEANEEEEARKEDQRNATRKSPSETKKEDESEEDDDEEAIMDESDSDESHTITEGSYVKIKDERPADETMPDDEDDNEPDVFDVNIVAWDSPMSPLHCAIMQGHIDVIELLVQTFGADVLLPVKLMDRAKVNTRAAILTLVLALQLDPEKRKAVTRKLLDLGASSSQADMDQNTVLHYVVKEDAMEVLDLLFECDEPAARNAINHLSISDNQWNGTVSLPLLTAVSNRKLAMVNKLLDLGVEPKISFESFMFSWMKKFDGASKDPDSNKKLFQRKVEQPVTVAAQSEFPQLVRKLLSKGANLNTMTTLSYDYLEHPNGYNKNGETILDIIQKRLEKLKKYKGEANRDAQPADLERDSHYLSRFQKDTYQGWAAVGDLEQAKSVHEAVLKNYEPVISENEKEGANKKAETIKAMIKELSETEKVLVKGGAKTFDQLHPKLKGSQQGNQGHQYHQAPTEPFKINFQFLVPDLNDNSKEGYLQLFQAAWDGDIPKVKSLTLGTWGDSCAPVRAAVQDQRGFCPFSIAVYRGHLDLARTILDISAAQYHPKDSSGKRERWHLRSEYGEDSMDSDDEKDDEVHVFGELVDENFTVDDIGAVGNTVRSDVTPLMMILWSAQFWRCLDLPEQEAKESLACEGNTYIHSYWRGRYRNRHDSWSSFQQLFNDRNSQQRCSLHRYVINKGDKQLLKFLIDLEIDLRARDQDEDEMSISKLSVISQTDFKYAMTLDRIDILQEIILKTGHGLPVQQLIKKSGIEIQEKPKNYRGLSVYGRKRKDWARAGRGAAYVPPEKRHSPLHISAFEGSLESLEWFLNGAPLRKYRDFVRNNQDNVYLKKLADAEGGIDKSLAGWLSAREHLALHAAVMGKVRKEDESSERISMVLSRYPNSLDRKSKEGNTPLHLAFELRRISSARFLIEAGADQTLRDERSRNLLHLVLRPRDNKEIPSLAALKEWLKLVDKRLVKSMFLERCSVEPTSLTPLAYWLHGNFNHLHGTLSYPEIPDMLRTILEYSGNQVLDVMDGAGDYPLHVLIRNGHHKLIPVVLEVKPALLFRENAVGMTPLEMCQTMHLRKYIDHPPKIESNHWPHRLSPPLDERTPTDFAEDKVRPMEDQADTYRICNAAAKKQSAKRKLVSLFDANAVAKRLAGRKSRGIGMNVLECVDASKTEFEDGVADEGVDEIADWYQRAK